MTVCLHAMTVCLHAMTVLLHAMTVRLYAEAVCRAPVQGPVDARISTADACGMLRDDAVEMG